MSRASKTITLFAALAITPMLLAPKVIGLVISNAHHEGFGVMFPQGGQVDPKFIMGDIREGWFNSESDFTLTISTAGIELPAATFRAQVQHGPVIVMEDSLVFAVARTKLLPTDPSFPAEIDIDVITHLDLSNEIKVSIENLSFEDESTELQAQNVTAQFSVTRERQGTFNIELGDLIVSDPNNEQGAAINSLELRGVTEDYASATAPYSLAIHSPGIELIGAESTSIDQLLFNTELTANSESSTASLKQHLSVSNISGNSSIESFSWQFDILEMSQETLEGFITLLPQFDSLNQSSNSADIARLNELSNELALLVANHPFAVESNLNATAYDGNHTATAKLKWQSLPALDNFLRLNIEEALGALAFEFSTSLDLKAVNNSPFSETARSLNENGQLNIDNGRIIANINIVDGNISINDRPISLEELF